MGWTDSDEHATRDSRGVYWSEEQYFYQKWINYEINFAFKKYFSVHMNIVNAIILGIIILVYIYYNGGDK